MSFNDVKIRTVTTTVPAPPVDGYREDLLPGDVVTMSLIDVVTGLPPNATSYRWEITGRPELSGTGPGPEPILLGVGASAAFTVDADVGAVRRDGTYLITCLLNGGAPTATRITVGLVRKTSWTIPGLPDPRTLRKLGGFESLEDGDPTTPLVLQGWAKQLNRWLDFIIGLASGSLPAPAADHIHEPLTNASGFLQVKGTVVRINGDGTFTTTEADSATITDKGLVGTIYDVSIANGVSGLVATHGQASIRMLAGLTLAADEPIYLAANFDGYGTNVPPDGDYIQPFATAKDVSTYTGVLGDLIVADLQISATPPLRQRSVNKRTFTVDATPTTAQDLVLTVVGTYLVEVSVVGDRSDVPFGSYVAKFDANIRFVGGAIAFVGGGPVPGINQQDGAVASALTVAGTNTIRVTVTGVAAQTWTWSTTITIKPCKHEGAS